MASECLSYGTVLYIFYVRVSFCYYSLFSSAGHSWHFQLCLKLFTSAVIYKHRLEPVVIQYLAQVKPFSFLFFNPLCLLTAIALIYSVYSQTSLWHSAERQTENGWNGAECSEPKISYFGLHCLWTRAGLLAWFWLCPVAHCSIIFFAFISLFKLKHIQLVIFFLWHITFFFVKLFAQGSLLFSDFVQDHG